MGEERAKQFAVSEHFNFYLILQGDLIIDLNTIFSKKLGYSSNLIAQVSVRGYDYIQRLVLRQVWVPPIHSLRSSLTAKPLVH